MSSSLIYFFLLCFSNKIHQSNNEIPIHEILMDAVESGLLLKLTLNALKNEIFTGKYQINEIQFGRDEKKKRLITFMKIEDYILITFYTEGLDPIPQSKLIVDNLRYLEHDRSQLKDTFENILITLNNLTCELEEEYLIHINIDLFKIPKKKLKILNRALLKSTFKGCFSCCDTLVFLESKISIVENIQLNFDMFVCEIFREIFKKNSLNYNKSCSIVKMIYDFVFLNEKSIKKFVSSMLKCKKRTYNKIPIQMKIFKRLMEKDDTKLINNHRKLIFKHMKRYYRNLSVELSLMYSDYTIKRIPYHINKQNHQKSELTRLILDFVLDDLIFSCLEDPLLFENINKMKAFIEDSIIRQIRRNEIFDLRRCSKRFANTSFLLFTFEKYVESMDSSIYDISYEIVNSIHKKSKTKDFLEENILNDFVIEYIINLNSLIENRVKVYLFLFTIMKEGVSNEFLDTFDSFEKKSQFIDDVLAIEDFFLQNLT